MNGLILICVSLRTPNFGFYDRLAEWIKRLRPRVGLDLVVYTPFEVEEMRKHANFFTQEIEKKGRELYVA